eukprot:scaffold12073_cov70-Cyclotella_meneghiniana.AAC.2
MMNDDGVGGGWVVGGGWMMVQCAQDASDGRSCMGVLGAAVGGRVSRLLCLAMYVAQGDY